MVYRKLITQLSSLRFKNNNSSLKFCLRCLHRSAPSYENEKKMKEVVVRRSFEDVQDKTKNTYLEMVQIFINRDQVHRRNHVEFVYAALKNMKDFGVHKDLEVYKSLIDVFPKGKLVPQNLLQAEFMHYPKQQQAAIDVLEQMEDNGVMPDYEMEKKLLEVFGRRGYPLRKFWRMMYWMPKFKNLSPWPVPNPPPNDTFELAKMAIARISSVDPTTKVTIYETAHIPESIDETWIVSAQSPIQKGLLEKHDVKKPVYVEGSFRVWLRDKSVNYFILRANLDKPLQSEIEDIDDVKNIEVPTPLFNIRPPMKSVLKTIPSVHEQKDGIILSVCATGTSSKDSLLSWIRHLENDGNQALGKIPVVFTLRSGVGEVALIDDENKELNVKETEKEGKEFSH